MRQLPDASATALSITPFPVALTTTPEGLAASASATVPDSAPRATASVTFPSAVAAPAATTTPATSRVT